MAKGNPKLKAALVAKGFQGCAKTITFAKCSSKRAAANGWGCRKQTTQAIGERRVSTGDDAGRQVNFSLKINQWCSSVTRCALAQSAMKFARSLPHVTGGNTRAAVADSSKYIALSRRVLCLRMLLVACASDMQPSNLLCSHLQQSSLHMPW